MNGKDEQAIEKHKPKDLQRLPPEVESIPALRSEQDFELEIVKLIPTAGTIKLTEKQRKILYADVDEKAVEIRPDGLIYLPWMEYVTRLREAFEMRWAIIPRGQPKFGPEKKSIIWGFYLIIEGNLAGFAIGEQEYHADNPIMNWSDACEGAKSNALMRLCKGLGISLELWKPSFINKWKEKYAVTYWNEDKEKYFWKKKGEKEEKPKEEKKGKGKKTAATPPPPKKKPEKAEPPKETPKEPETGPGIEDLISLILSHGKIQLGNPKFGEKGDKDYPLFKEFLNELGAERQMKLVGTNKYKKLSIHEANREQLSTMCLHLNWVFKHFRSWKELKKKEEEQENKEGFAGDDGEVPF